MDLSVVVEDHIPPLCIIYRMLASWVWIQDILLQAGHDGVEFLLRSVVRVCLLYRRSDGRSLIRYRERRLP